MVLGLGFGLGLGLGIWFGFGFGFGLAHRAAGVTARRRGLYRPVEERARPLEALGEGGRVVSARRG